MIRTANIEVSLQRLSILRIEHPQANPLRLACTLRAGETLPSGLTITAEIHTSRNVAAETAPLASSSVTVAADATSFEVLFDSPQTNQTVTPDSTRALWLVVYGVGDADQLYTFAAADLLLGWHAISTLTADPPATAILVEKGGVAWASGRTYVSGTVVTVGTTAYVATADNTSTADDQPGVGQEWESFWVVLSGGGGGATNLGATVSPTQIIITSDTGTDAAIPAADGTNAGLMLPAEKTKLAGVAAGATANSSDAALIARGNHTGTQAISTIVNLQTSLDGKAATSHTHSIADVTGLQTALDGKAASSHTHSASQINDSTAAGRAVLTAADATAQRTALGLGTLATQSGTFSGTSSGTNTGNVTLATSVSSVLALSGQQLQAVTDPGADRIVFFDQSANAGAGAWGYLVAGTGLSITGTTITATFNPASPGAIGGTTPSTAVFTTLDVQTGLDVQSTSGAAGPILSWNTPTTEATNWERARLQWSSNVFVIGTAANGTGVAREVEIQPGGTTAARFTTAGRTILGGAAIATNTTLTVGVPVASTVSPAAGNAVGVSITNATSFALVAEATSASSASGGCFASLYANDGAAMASGDRMGGFLIGGSSSSANLRASTIAEVYATEAWTDGSAYGSAWNFATTENGTTTRAGKLWINHNGNIGIGYNSGAAVFSVAVQPTARLQIRGAGTGTGVALLVENSSGTARFTVRDDGAFAFAGGTVAAADTGWTTFTNLTTDRTCDANATTVEELADILGTLIVALKAKGIIAN